ncbi:MAG: D-alanyl-D-alanine carboxypeptidase family protein [Clostridia bacterium]|nr:D-alanyl-D-alanine carboxypeptidase family protein [Clostridia bacterium]
MRIIQTILSIALTLALVFIPAAASADPAYMGGDSDDPLYAGACLVADMPVSLSCASAILCEPESGQVILEQNADEPRPMASVTKVMSILLALEAVEQGRAALEDEVTVSANASGMGGSQVFLDTNETIRYSELLRSMIVASANDATVAVGEYLFGSQDLFVQQMNERAQELGMTNTHFVNATGLPAEGHVSTARDIARAFTELIRHDIYFDYSGIWMEDLNHSDGRVTSLTNTNRLIRLYEGCDGGKTGFTNAAGYCLAATANRGDMRLICVVLGSETSSLRFDSASSLLDYGFANYRLYPVARQGTAVKGEISVRGGNPETIPLLLGRDLTLLLPKGDENSVQFSANLQEALDAPVQEGDVCGSVDVVLHDEIVAQLPLLAGAGSEASGWKPSLLRFWRHWTVEGGEAS